MSNYVLIVDDDPMIRKLLSRMLATRKYETLTASGGEEALELLKENEFTHIILDLNMPAGISGVETLKRINKLNSSIPIILSTGDGSIIDRDEYRKMGVSQFLNKPFDLNELFSVII